jgi:hypothetical protein
MFFFLDAFIILTVCVVFSDCLCSIYVCVLSVVCFLEGVSLEQRMLNVVTFSCGLLVFLTYCIVL